MNLQRLHDSLISRAKNRVLSEGFEVHHVIPRSLGGTDDIDNLVKLTHREHFIVHHILAKIHGGTQWAPLLYWKERNSRVYEKARKEVSRLMKSQDPWNKGLTGGSWSDARRESQKYVVHKGLSEETKAKMRKPKSLEHANKIKMAKAGKKGVPLTDEHKQKVSFGVKAAKLNRLISSIFI